MPTFEKGNMFDVWGKTDLFLFTSNPIVNKQGLAVMGRGVAKQLADKNPQIREDFGAQLKSFWKFHVGVLGTYDGQDVGWFMVKDHWADKAKMEVIHSSIVCLYQMALKYPDKRFDLNFPGIGNGKLPREEVLPSLLHLPENVHVWEYE